MTVDALAAKILSSPRFDAALSQLAVSAVRRDLLEPARGDQHDWSYLLSCASALSMSADEGALEAALRVAHGALSSPTAEVHRDAAVFLLDRLGNQPAIALARRRGWITATDLTDYPAPLRMEIVRSRLELSVPGQDGAGYAVNRFQRDLWTAADASTWVSATAPTSAGKSFIVRRWFRERALRAVVDGKSTTLVAVVPTRALVEEISRELANELPSDIPVRTIPFGSTEAATQVEVFVLTQERLHLLQQRDRKSTIDLLFVDEAHKLNDGARGVLLHQVIDETVRRNSSAQVIFATPLAADPETLLLGAPNDASTATVDSRAVTVTQNLLYANQVPRQPKRWQLDLVLPSGHQSVGGFELIDRPHPPSKRLPLVAVALGSGGGNLIYADGAAAAEKMASVIFDAVGQPADATSDPEVADLIELVERTVNPHYGLARTLRRGVAFHYGNIPQLVRTGIENLFRLGKVQYLVCTSTLLEGVNLPCRSIFVRDPHRGRGNVMTASDFWNLAGRAGRWGTEFDGHIVCVDTEDERRWPQPPVRRVRQKLRREAADIVAQPDALLEYIRDGTPPHGGRRELEAVYSFLAARVANGISVTEVIALALSAESAAALTEVVQDSLQAVSLPPEFLARHAGISPLLMERLLRRMDDYSAEELLLAHPEDRDSWGQYARVFGLLAEEMGADFGGPPRRRQLGALIVQWMRGLPLARLIQDRLDFEASRETPKPVPVTIRSVMDDVENVARFLAPKYLACYRDVLGVHLTRVEREDLADSGPVDIELMLEFGVSTRTELSLLELGLSRTSAVELFTNLASDSMSVAECIGWLRQESLEHLDMPALVRREIERVAANY